MATISAAVASLLARVLQQDGQLAGVVDGRVSLFNVKHTPSNVNSKVFHEVEEAHR